MQAYDSIMCRYFCIGFIDVMFKGKSLTDYTNLFSANGFEKNDDTVVKYLWAIHIYKNGIVLLKVRNI